MDILLFIFVSCFEITNLNLPDNYSNIPDVNNVNYNKFRYS